jgi:signal transduction histidine kinase
VSADQLLQHLTNVLFVVIFLTVAARAVQRPTGANVDTALLFGALAAAILIGWIDAALGVTPPTWVSALTGSLAMSLPYLLLRLVDDFAGVPGWVLRLAEVGFAASVIALAVLQPTLPVPVLIALVVYFAVLTAYASMRFVRQAAESRGVTRRRMQSVALGSALLALAIIAAGVNVLVPSIMPVGSLLLRAAALGSGIAYYLGFAPPTWLRRAWQEPELREFLSRAASLPRLPDTASIERELAIGAATSLGAHAASIGLWDAARGRLRFMRSSRPSTIDGLERSSDPGRLTLTADGWEVDPANPISGRAFATQTATYTSDAVRADPINADIYRAYGAEALLAAPVTAGDQRLGVLVVYARRAPIFADSDLELLRLLADQAAVILESRGLIDQATRVQAREEATRLKDDFLSAAAHDLKTPLTTMIAQAQLLERRAIMRPGDPPDIGGIQRIVGEARRLNELVLELLDASRVEQGQLVGPREPTDLVELARAAVARIASPVHTCVLEADGPVEGEYDAGRIDQVLTNLLENAIKYSPAGGEVRVQVRRDQDGAHIAVVDQGIGIPANDLSYVFDRFHRGSNVDDRRFAGMGLGLYICRGIVEQHGGRIWVESQSGAGSTFHVLLP